MAIVQTRYILRNPVGFLKVVFHASLLLCYRLVRKLCPQWLWPGPRTSTWLTIATSFFAAPLAHDWHFLLVAPENVEKHDAILVPLDQERLEPEKFKFSGYLLADEALSTSENQKLDLARADAVWIHTHGGGFISGEALMHLKSYKRWIKKAREIFGMDLRILTVEYPLSAVEPYPGALQACKEAYQWVLKHGAVPESTFAVGDSAGGNLAISLTCALYDETPSVKLAGTIMLSPLLDLTCEHVADSPCSETDWVTSMSDAGAVHNIKTYCGDMIKSPADPRVSPLRRKSLRGLPPQFVSAGDREMLFEDSRRWVARCKRELGDDMVEHDFGCGQIHMFAIGGWLADTGFEESSDVKILTFVRSNTSQAAVRAGRIAK